MGRTQRLFSRLGYRRFFSKALTRFVVCWVAKVVFRTHQADEERAISQPMQVESTSYLQGKTK